MPNAGSSCSAGSLLISNPARPTLTHEVLSSLGRKPMSRKLNASLLALTGLLIALGAFGHSFMGRKALDMGLAHLALDAHTDKLIYLVWYFCGGCMLVFGALVMAGAWRAWRGENHGLSVAGLIGVF